MKKKNKIVNIYQVSGLFLILFAGFLGFGLLQTNYGIGNFEFSGAGDVEEEDCDDPNTDTIDSCSLPGPNGGGGGGYGSFCDSDSDCPDGEYCSLGVCSYTQNPSNGCNSGADCGACQDCIQGTCVFRCESNLCCATSCGPGCSSGKCPGEEGYNC